MAWRSEQVRSLQLVERMLGKRRRRPDRVTTQPCVRHCATTVRGRLRRHGNLSTEINISTLCPVQIILQVQLKLKYKNICLVSFISILKEFNKTTFIQYLQQQLDNALSYVPCYRVQCGSVIDASFVDVRLLGERLAKILLSVYKPVVGACLVYAGQVTEAMRV